MRDRIINTWRDPYDEGFFICRPKQITIKSGLTVLVGCNGAGKTTLLHNIRDELKKENIPYHLYDNLHLQLSNWRTHTQLFVEWVAQWYLCNK